MQLEQIRELGKRITETKDSVTTEEATKHSYVMPFLSLLGYDIFNPKVVVPEFTSDIGTKKGEKVDYAILKDGEPLILIEVKKHNENLDNHTNQLIRYFHVTNAKFGVLTNGIEYRFFSDLEKENIMDTKPFLVINVENFNERDLKELDKFTSKDIDVNSILKMAIVNKNVREIKNIFKLEVETPSNDLCKFFATKVFEESGIKKSITQSILNDFKYYVGIAFKDIINDLAKEKIDSLNSQLKMTEPKEEIVEEGEVITTEIELQGYYIIKSIIGEYIDVDRVFYRDNRSYFNILIDDNNRKWVARLFFNGKQLHFKIPTIEGGEERIDIESVNDLYKYKAQLTNIVQRIK
jgi:predicted type IV restriction endonuclease